MQKKQNQRSVVTILLLPMLVLYWLGLHDVVHFTRLGSYLLCTVYFSMVTLTTLGYGDITPQTPGAAALCQVEAIVGQFFTAVLVAWFAGMYIADKRKEKE